jgi:hypothetical protein
MDVLVNLAPVALIVLVCGGMHFLMMKGMHGGHEAGAGHEGHSGLGSEDSPDRVAQLESQVARLQREIEASQSDGQNTRNGHSREPVVAMHRHVEAAGDDPGRGYN